MALKKRTKLIAVYLLLIAVVAVIAYSLAAYTNLSSAKRVVTVRGSEQYFTSDILLQYDNESTLQSRVKSFGKNDKTRTFSVKVSNHLQNDTTKYDKKNITYNFQVELVDSDGKIVTDSKLQSACKVDNNELKDGKYTKSETFKGGAAQDETYQIILTGDEILQYRIKITADPKSSRSEYKALGRLILLAIDSTTTNWTGSFLATEQDAVNKDKTLSLLNYRITGYLEEDCTLTWDSSKVEIDKWFLEQMGISDEPTADKDGKKSVRLHLGAAGTPQQYTIQFYRTYAVNDLKKEDWKIIQSYVQFKNSKGE